MKEAYSKNCGIGITDQIQVISIDDRLGINFQIRFIDDWKVRYGGWIDAIVVPSRTTKEKPQRNLIVAILKKDGK